MLIIVCGLPGTGKTALSKRIANKLVAVHLNTDVIRKKIFTILKYSEREKGYVYKKLLEEAESFLKKGQHVILDGTFYKKSLREKALAVANKNNEKYFIIECRAAEKTIEEWIKNRIKRKTTSDATFSIYKKIKQQFEPIEEEHFIFYTDKDFNNQFKTLIEALRSMFS